MNEFLAIAIVACFNLFVGMFTGYILAHRRISKKIDFEEKQVYCHGFEDGIYYTLDEYNPDLFRIEIAESCYKEYKAIKHGPEKH